MAGSRLLVLYEWLEVKSPEAAENYETIRSVWKGEVEILPFAIGMAFENIHQLDDRRALMDYIQSRRQDGDYVLIARIWRQKIPPLWIKELSRHLLITMSEYVELNDVEYGRYDHLRLEMVSSGGWKHLKGCDPLFLPDGRLNVTGSLSRIPLFPSLELVEDYFSRGLEDGFYKFPNQVSIESSSGCNLACTMCYFQSNEIAGALDWTVDHAIMPMALYEGILEEISGFDPLPALMFCHRGEELLDKKFVQKVQMAKQGGHNVILNTNGLLLDEKRASGLLDAGIDVIGLSCESLDKEIYEKIMVKGDLGLFKKNVENLLRMRGSDTNTLIGIKMVYLEDNHADVDEYREYWFDQGVDFVSFQNEVFRRDDGVYDVRNAPLTLPHHYPCRNLFLNMMINADGVVQSCAVPYADDKSAKIGRFPDQSILELWQGKIESYRNFALTRDWDKIPYCEHCSGSMCKSFVFDKSMEGQFVKTLSPNSVFYQRMS